MKIGRPALIASLLALSLAGALSGCANPGPFAERRNTLASLKTSVSHLEHENGQLKAKVSELSQENRRIEDRLVQEEAVNGDLQARLDDARNLLTDRSGGAAAPSDSQTRPVRRSTKPPRRPPAASIPGPDEETETEPITIPRRGDDMQSNRRDESSWLPVARGVSSPTYRLR